ncbi:parvalbumin-like EF-hand-containing protein [Aplochiton taeniatus]
MTDNSDKRMKKVAQALGTSHSHQDVDPISRERRLQGNLNYSRFLEYMRQFKTPEQQEESIKRAFQQLDKDGSGYIEWNEIKYILSTIPSSTPVVPLSDEEAEATIQAADIDGDGRLDFREFADMVKLEKKPRK